MNNKKTVFAVLAAVVIASAGILIWRAQTKQTPGLPDMELNDVKTDDSTYAFLQLETKKNNLVYSPISIKYALHMLSDGAKGKTKTEIDNVLGDDVLPAYQGIEKHLAFANGLFIRDTYESHIVSGYKELLQDSYNADLICYDFNSADRINSWISDNTLGLINNLLEDRQVQISDVVLANALAIDMEWQSKFDEVDTRGAEFTNGDKTSNAAFMYKKTSAKTNSYYKSDDLTMVSMPLKEYGDTQLEFIAIMPNDLDNYIKENKIRDDLKKLQEPTDKQELAIMIPRFKFEYDLHLKQDMQKLGINTVFDKDNADLSGISDTGKLFVNDAIHRANIEFSEEGIKAAAVTVILMTDATAIRDQMQTISLYFNKPFMFLIRDAKNGEEWFTGTVYEPILWDDVKSDYDPQ